MSKDHIVLTGEDMSHQKPYAFDAEKAQQQHDITVQLYRKYIEECHTVNKKCYDRSRKDFRSFQIEEEVQRESESHRYDLELKVNDQAASLRFKNREKLDSISERIKFLEKEMVSLMTEMKLKQKLKQNEQLFTIKSIEENFQKLQQLKNDIKVQGYEFHVDSSIKPGLEKMIKAGIKNISTDITCAGKIDVKSPDDMKDCNVNGIAILSDVYETRPLMFITDEDNQCLKLIDVVQGTVIKKHSLTSRPSDVTAIPYHNSVAVAVPNLRQLQIFACIPYLEPRDPIDVDHGCISVKSTGDRLVLGYENPPKVQIIDLSGKVLKSFTTDSSGNPLFGLPRFLSMSPDHTSILISDWEKKNVTRMSTEGTIEWVYRDNDLKLSRGVTTGPDGCLYICNREPHTLHVVSAAGVKQKIIPVDQFQIYYPWAICCCKDQDILYVISGLNAYRNIIHRFTFH